MKQKIKKRDELLTIGITILTVLTTLFLLYNFLPLSALKYFSIKGWFGQKLGVTLTYSTVGGTTLISDLDTILTTTFTELNAGKIDVGSTTINAITTLSNLTTIGTLTSLSVTYASTTAISATNIDLSGYILSTSTTATSTLPQLDVTDLGATRLEAGTITAGDWNGSVIGMAYGGSNKALSASNGTLVYSDANSFELLAVGTNGKVLALESGLPVWVASTTLATISGDTDDISEGSSNLYEGTTAGRSLTLSTLSVAADAELYTGAITFGWASTTMGTTTTFMAHKVANAITITSVEGHCFGIGTTTIDIEQNDSTIFSYAFTMGWFDEGNGNATTTSAFADATVPADSWLVLDIDGYMIGDPTNCAVTVKYTKDD